MFLASVALISLILAAVTRRPVRRLLEIRFRYLGLLLAGAAVQALLVRPASLPLLSSSPVIALPPVGALLYIASLASLLVFGYTNRHNLGIALIATGLLLNTVVIAANGGQMPVAPEKISFLGPGQAEMWQEGGAWLSKTVAGPDTRIMLLGDWILVPQMSGHPAILSPGDLLIVAGIFLFFMVISEQRARGTAPATPPVSRVPFPG